MHASLYLVAGSEGHATAGCRASSGGGGLTGELFGVGGSGAFLEDANAGVRTNKICMMKLPLMLCMHKSPTDYRHECSMHQVQDAAFTRTMTR